VDELIQLFQKVHYPDNMTGEEATTLLRPSTPCQQCDRTEDCLCITNLPRDLHRLTTFEKGVSNNRKGIRAYTTTSQAVVFHQKQLIAEMVGQLQLALSSTSGNTQHALPFHEADCSDPQFLIYPYQKGNWVRLVDADDECGVGSNSSSGRA
jgi:hypothetical protein